MYIINDLCLYIKYGIRRPDAWIVPACVVKPFQIIQNEAAHLIFDQPNRTHVAMLYSVGGPLDLHQVI